MSKNQDFIFEKMAKLYADNMGEELKMEHANVHINLDTGVLDQRVYANIAKEKKKTKISSIQKYAKVVIPVAASLLIVFMIASWNLGRTINEKIASENSDVHSSEAMEGKMIPISYPLPPNLSVIDQELDNGMTIYHLEDTAHDNVVMQLAYVESIDYEVKGMQEILVNGVPVYATVDNDYQKITFEKDGIIYILTCKYDLNTLLPICENIL